MNNSYSDITSQIDGAPRWWDENAVPRYCEFSPREVADIYSDEALLLWIECQACAAKFDVAFSSSRMSRVRWATREQAVGSMRPDLKSEMRNETLAVAVMCNKIHYGDPPNYNCCPAGPTMNSVPLLVKEFWTRSHQHDWERVPALERQIDCPWIKEND